MIVIRMNNSSININQADDLYHQFMKKVMLT